MSTIRHHPPLEVQLPPLLVRRLRDHCEASRLSERVVLEEAINEYLDGITDTSRILRRFDHVARVHNRMLRELDLLTQALSMFVRLWLAHNPQLPRDARAAARAVAESRSKQFLEHVAARFASGKRFFDDPPQDRGADDDGLGVIARAAEADRASRRDSGSGGTPLPS